MSNEIGHRLAIEICEGTPLLDDACKHLGYYKDTEQGRRLQELFRCFVSVGCVIEDFSVISDLVLNEVNDSVEFLKNEEPESMMPFRFRLYNDEEDEFLPGFSARYIRSPKSEKKIFVTKLYLLGFWFFTRFSEQFKTLIPRGEEIAEEVRQITEVNVGDDQPIYVEHNEDAMNLLGGLDICL